MIPLRFFSGFALALAGCSTCPPAGPARVPISPADQHVDIGGRSTAPPPRGLDAPVYRNPTIGVVRLRAYQDAEGRLFGPQTMYQIVEPGGWNVDVAEARPQSSRPTSSLSADPSESLSMLEPPNGEHRPLLDPDQAKDIVLTGLMHPSDRPQAEAMARAAGDRASIYDRDAGWLLVRRVRKVEP